MGKRTAVATSNGDDDNTCECRICRFFYAVDIPIAGSSFLHGELQKNARLQSAEIFRTWIQLHVVIKRYEQLIRKRWLKKTYAQRTAILSQAWPGIPSTHRPDFAWVRDHCLRVKARPDKEKSRQAHLWPYVNLEDLVGPDNLLVFINARARSMPWKFAFTDKLNAHMIKSNEPTDVDSYRMIFYNQKTPKSYGKLLLAKPHKHKLAVHDLYGPQLGLDPSIGLQVLEIQSRLLSFLHSCCHIILRDYDMSSSIATLPTLPGPTIHQLDSPQQQRNIRAFSVLAPYRLPQRLRCGDLLAVVEARFSDAEDHIWSLREDPSYFARHVRDWAEHSPSQIHNSNGEPHSCVGKAEFWRRAASDMISHAYGALIWWDAACNDLTTLREFERIQRAEVQPSQQLTIHHYRVFRAFDSSMKGMISWPLADIKHGFAASPPMRKHYTRPSGYCHPALMDMPLSSGGPDVHRIHFLIKGIVTPGIHKVHGLSNIVEELQRTIDVEGDKMLLSSWITDRFSDLAMIVEIRRQLDMYQPWAMIWRDGEDEIMECECGALHTPATDEADSVKDLVEEMTDRVMSKNLKLSPDPACFPYPSEKRRTEATVNQMRESEKRLDQFWDTLDDLIIYEFDCTLNELLCEHFADFDREIHRTPRWKAPKVQSMPNTENHSSSPTDTLEAIRERKTLSELDPNARHTRPTKASLMTDTPTKEKLKTRGHVGLHKKLEARPLPVRNKAQKAPDTRGKVFYVSRRAFKVFATLFHVSDEHQVAGEISWVDFVYAMASLGFATEKLYGSSWQFSPPKPGKQHTTHGLLDQDEEGDEMEESVKAKDQTLGCTQNIQFHEPHPGSKLRFWEARRMGRRLSKTYGWNGNTFLCK